MVELKLTSTKYLTWALIILVLLSGFLLWIVIKNKLVIIDFKSVTYNLIFLVCGVAIGYVLFYRKKLKTIWEIANRITKEHFNFFPENYALKEEDFEAEEITYMGHKIGIYYWDFLPRLFLWNIDEQRVMATRITDIETIKYEFSKLPGKLIETRIKETMLNQTLENMGFERMGG